MEEKIDDVNGANSIQQQLNNAYDYETAGKLDEDGEELVEGLASLN